MAEGQDPMGMGGGRRTRPNGDGWWLKDKTQWGWVVAEGQDPMGMGGG